MLSNSEIHVKLNQWLERFVEVPHPSLGGWAPCPYARAARVSDKIGVMFSTNDQFPDSVREAIGMLDNKDVVVICFDHNKIAPTELQEWVAKINQMLLPINYVLLEDHPLLPESINGVPMNFGYCGLLVIQKLDKLNTAAEQLKIKGYYDVWSNENITEVVAWRNEIL